MSPANGSRTRVEGRAIRVRPDEREASRRQTESANPTMTLHGRERRIMVRAKARWSGRNNRGSFPERSRVKAGNPARDRPTRRQFASKAAQH